MSIPYEVTFFSKDGKKHSEHVLAVDASDAVSQISERSVIFFTAIKAFPTYEIDYE